MAYHIQIEHGQHAGFAHELSDEVVRIGALPQMSVVLEGLPDHAVTLHRTDEGCSVINRGCQHLKIGRKQLQLDQQSTWRPGQTMVINREHAFRLQQGPPRLGHAFSLTETGTEMPLGCPRQTRHSRWIAAAVAILLASSATGFVKRPHYPDSEVFLARLITGLERAPRRYPKTRNAAQLLRKASIWELIPDKEQKRRAAAAFIELRDLAIRFQHKWPGELARNLRNYAEYRLRHVTP